MTKEFKVKKYKDATVYTLESASGGSTSAGAVASVSSPLGHVRKRGDNLIAQEEKKEAPKPRNFVAKNAKMGGAGAHKDKKKEQKQGNEKHKKPYMESLKQKIEDLKSKLNEMQGVAEGMAGMDDAEPYTIGGAVDKQYVYTVMRDGKSMGIYHSLDDAKSIVANNKRTNKYSEFKIQRKPRNKMAGPVGQLPEQGVAEGSEQVYNVLAVDKSNALSKQVKLKVKASSLDEVFERLAINDWYPLEINGVEVINGKRLKQGVAEVSKATLDRYVPKAVDAHGHADFSARMSKDDPTLRSYHKDQKKTAEKRRQGISRALDRMSKMEGVAEGASDYVGNAIEDLRASKPGLDRETFLDELYFYIDAQYGKQAADAAFSREDDATFDEWYDSYTDLMEGDEYFRRLEGMLNEDWQKANRRDKTDGMSRKAVNAYRRENPGSKLKTAVTTKPSKLKKGGKAAKRRKSFCARMSGNKGPMKKPNGKPTPKALALRRWNCEEDAYMNSLNQQVLEKLNPQADVDVWVQDFQKADPNKYKQFKNKTPQKKAQMAVAAHYAANEPSKKK